MVNITDFSMDYYSLKGKVAIITGFNMGLGSALSYTSDKHCPPYTVSKHGVIGLTKVFANELGAYNIQINAICPGFLATDVNVELRKDSAYTAKSMRVLQPVTGENL